MSMVGSSSVKKAAEFLRSLRRDRSGNAIMIVAAAALPLLAMIGGAVDMSRSYLSESRLQQACDAGVLAARKRLGSTVVGGGVVPAFVADAGNKFFNINFRNNTYGTANRNFVMTLEPDYSISGVATVEVPTTIMRLFGYSVVKLQAKCQAKVNFNNTDIMMVLDTTASMDAKAVATDANSKMVTMKTVIKNFHKQMEESKGPSIRVRYGFVPYSTNVNVGALLNDNWVVNTSWDYQTREVHHTVLDPVTTTSWNENYTAPTGTYSSTIASSYPATWHLPATEADSGYYSCDGPALPADTLNVQYTPQGAPVVTPWVGPPAGNKVVQHYRWRAHGESWRTETSGATCNVRHNDYNNYQYEYDYVTVPYQTSTTWYNYAKLPYNVANWRTDTQGCVEERKTYEIDDYTNVDFTRALDLDIRTVPNPTDDNTKWKPMYPAIVFARALDHSGGGSFSFPPVITDDFWLFQPNQVPNMVTCPTPARKLAEMPLDTGSPLTSNATLDAYLSSIVASGTTYHDIGMLWGARLLTSFGLFASENADVSPASPTSRHLIFLTDGQTEAYDIAYGAYGVEPLDRRRWNKEAPVGGLTLNQVVEKRFAVACDQAKADNITVWVIGFGTTVSPMMQTCAGNGHWFQANNASDLNVAFTQIAGSLGDLRISK